jgi:4'-phosphopantetheinyl transferase
MYQEVHLYCAPLDTLAAGLDHFPAILNEEEQTRAARFHFARDRQRFIVARGGLRLLLSRYLTVAAEEITFCYNAYGKPSLAPPYAASGLTFNLAHAGEFVLYALAYGRLVGVDIEQVRPNMEYEQLARHVFSLAEQQGLQATPADERRTAFFHGWTRKEAYIKAQGQGLSLPLDQFTVTLAPDEPPRLVSTPHAPAEAARWSLQAVPTPPGYVGAVVAEGQDWRVCWPPLRLDEGVKG